KWNLSCRGSPCPAPRGPTGEEERQATKVGSVRTGERLVRSRSRRSLLPRLGESTVVAEICARLPAPGERVSVPSRLSPRRRSLRRAHRPGALRERPFGLPAAATEAAALPAPALWGGVELAVSRVAAPGATWPRNEMDGGNWRHVAPSSSPRPSSEASLAALPLLRPCVRSFRSFPRC